MKWIFFFVGLAVIRPCAGWVRQNRIWALRLWTLFGAMPFFSFAIDRVALISWPGWPGYVKGILFTSFDICALILYFSLSHKRPFPLPFRVSMLLYFLAVAISIFQAEVPEATAFYLWQLARAFMVYALVARGAVDERVQNAILTGMALSLGLQACVATYERFVLGALQSGGALGHQNLLGMLSHFVTFPLFALMLSGERRWHVIIGPVAGAVAAVMTVSRASVGLAAAGFAGMFLLSAIASWSPRKMKVALVGAAAMIVLVPFAVASFEKRFAGAQEDYGEREAFERAAEMMLADKPNGVGANNYVVFANSKGYMDRAGVAATSGSRSTSVHNAYRLAAAETGYFGLITFLILLLSAMTRAFRLGWRYRKTKEGELLFGISLSILVVSIHSLYEWALFLAATQFLMMIALGLLAAIGERLRGCPRTSSSEFTAPSS